MIDPDRFANLSLCEGFVIDRVEITSEPMVDALTREAIARTWVIGRKLQITVRAGLDDKEFSVTLYHEVLEALTVASLHPPASVMEFNEADFERASYEAFDRFGMVSAEGLNAMLHFYGFGEK